MQCGLNWTMMLKKRETFRRCFDDLDVYKRQIILCGTVIYELVGPLATKLALTKAGEIKKG